MNGRRAQIEKNPSEDPGISNTTKRSKQEKQSVRAIDKVYIRPTDKSIEL